MLPEHRDAVITIQGGGIYGLNLLGQLRAVIEVHKYGPLALAGTSAGAIVATLVWAGYTPSEIIHEFLSMARRDDQALLNLLGPFEPPPSPHFSLMDLKVLWSDATNLLSNAMATPEPPQGRWKWLRAAGRACQKPVKAATHSYNAFNLVNRLVPHIQRRGFFLGETLEEKIEQMLRARLDVPSGIRPDRPLTFRDFSDRAERDADGYRPPLLLTVTNLTTRRLELISSVDERYADVAVSRAVRASAGFPVFFRPLELPGAPEGGWFVDGGVVSNFPIWAFSEAFRQQLRSSKVFDEIAPIPWIRIGLRVVEQPTTEANSPNGDASVEVLRSEEDVSKPYPFFRSVVSMLAGTARNQLEEIISSKSARAIVIRETVGREKSEDGFLAVDRLDADRVEAMIASGFTWANRHLGQIRSPAIYVDGDATALVAAELETLVARCTQALGAGGEDVLFRANVFVPTEDFHMKLVFSYNMDADGDREIEFPDLRSGLTGFCYMYRKPQLCNLEEIRKLRESGNPLYVNLFGMDPKLQGQVRRDRTWLASVPIFDPYEVALSPHARQGEGAQPYEGQAYRGVETDMDGAVLGVLNLDSGWNFDKLRISPDPNEHFRDFRIQFILSLMQATAFSVARTITRVFPRDDVGGAS